MVDLYNDMITRQTTIINESNQEKLKKTHITIVGCGGLGGIIIELLVRAGSENLTIIDEDVYDTTNLNRQIRSNTDTIGKVKSEITKENALKINPDINITSKNVKITENNIKEVLDDPDLIIDAVDNVLTRVLLSRESKKLKIPFIHGAVDKTTGQLTVFMPESPSYEELFGLKSVNKELTSDVISYLKNLSKEKPAILGTSPAIFGSLEANEAIKYITGLGKNIIAPKIMIWNIFNLDSFTITEL